MWATCGEVVIVAEGNGRRRDHVSISTDSTTILGDRLIHVLIIGEFGKI